MGDYEFKLTEEGKREVQYFITECKAKRKEVLDNAGDTIKHTSIPTEKRFLMISIHKRMLMNVDMMLVGVLLITMG